MTWLRRFFLAVDSTGIAHISSSDRKVHRYCVCEPGMRWARTVKWASTLEEAKRLVARRRIGDEIRHGHAEIGRVTETDQVNYNRLRSSPTAKVK